MIKTIVLPAVRVDEALKKQLDDFAKETGRKTSDALRYLVGAGLRSEAREQELLERIRAAKERIDLQVATGMAG